MPAVARKGDKCTGHIPFPPRPSNKGSPNVYVNSKPVVRVTDTYEVHCGGTCHDGKQATGSPDTFANSLAVARIGDDIDCGSKVQEGSPNTFVN